MKNKIVLFFLAVVSFSYANENLDCLILEDEDSIICKYMHERLDYDKNVTVNWIDPNKELSRSREITIPAGHGSVYDFRYINGRMKGEWVFEVVEDNVSSSIVFTIE